MEEGVAGGAIRCEAARVNLSQHDTLRVMEEVENRKVLLH
jgi:hypothetical protein